MAQTTRMERGMAVLDLAAGTLQRGCLERIVADADRCAGAEEALRTTRVSLDMANTDRDELADRCAELEAELALQKRHTRRAENAHGVVSNQLGQAQQEIARLRAGMEKVRRFRNTVRSAPTKGDTWPGEAVNVRLTAALQVAGLEPMTPEQQDALHGGK